MQPFFEQDNLSLYCGDLREVLPTLPEASVDFVCTDPPYGLGLHGEGLGPRGSRTRVLAGRRTACASPVL